MDEERELEMWDEPEEDETIQRMQQIMEDFLDPAHVEAVYGEPVQNGEFMVIPTAEILSVVGFGMGSGYGSSTDEGEDNVGGGSGGGGGGRVLSRPVAVVIASPEGVRVEPVVDVTKLGLAALTAFGFMFGMVSRMRK